MGQRKLTVTMENVEHRRSTVVDWTMWLLLMATLSSCVTAVTARSYGFHQEKHCYQCHAGPDASINDICRQFDKNTKQPTISSCTHNCYVRYDNSGAVSRGCFHTTFATEEGEVRCQSITSSVYCFCDSERCNNKSLYELAPSLHFDLTFSKSSRSLEKQSGAPVEIQKSFEQTDISVTQKPNQSSSKTQKVEKIVKNFHQKRPLVTSEEQEPSGQSNQKEPKVFNKQKPKIVRTKWFKRRHDHGLSSKQNSFPYSFQSMFRNNYIY